LTRNQYQTQQVFRAANGIGPWLCEECDILVYRIGTESEDGNVHHRDHDETNDVPENLVVLHARCHGRLHVREAGEARNIKISITLTGRPRSEAARAAISAGKMGEKNHMFGVTQNERMRAQKSATMRGMTVEEVLVEWDPCQGCGQRYSRRHMKEHQPHGQIVCGSTTSGG
jgi:hypothetical protein